MFPLSMVPYSLPMLTHQLVVYVSLSEVSCLVHASGENLLFTYQSVPIDGLHEKQDDDAKSVFESVYFDLNNPQSVMVALLKSLDACPRSIRKFVISNIVFSGTGLLKQPQIPIAVAKQLKAVLFAANSQPATKHQSTTTETNPENANLPSNDNFNSYHLSVASPVNLKALSGLHAQVGLVSVKVRPDLMSWVGTNQWASHWQGQDPTLQKWTWVTEWPSKT